MAGKFNKMFNSTTINGRANVAKATYASFAIMYIIYRIRKRNKNAEDVMGKESDCGCHGSMTSPNGEENGVGTPPPLPPKGKEECRVCRDRAKKPNKDSIDGQQNAADNESATTKRKKCPCEDPHLHTDSDELTQKQQRQHDNDDHEGCASYKPGMSLTENKSDSSNMHEAIFRALRGMLGAVVGGSDANDTADSVAIFGSSDNNNNKSNENQSRTKDDDYLDGIGPELSFDD